MDSIPYEFVSNVFSKLSAHHCSKHAKSLNSLIWEDVSQVNRQKRQNYFFHIYPTSLGLAYAIFDPVRDCETLTFEEFLARDPRFHQIFVFSTKVPPVHYRFSCDEKRHLVGRRLPEMLRFVGEFNLELARIESSENARLKLVQRPLMAQLSIECLKTKLLDITYCAEMEHVLSRQIQSEELTRLHLNGTWPVEVQSELEAFVCRPNFRSLRSQDYQCLDSENIRQILAYYKSLPLPWTEATITMKRTSNLIRQLAQWPTTDVRSTTGLILDSTNHLIVVASCSIHSIKVYFR